MVKIKQYHKNKRERESARSSFSKILSAAIEAYIQTYNHQTLFCCCWCFIRTYLTNNRSIYIYKISIKKNDRLYLTGLSISMSKSL